MPEETKWVDVMRSGEWQDMHGQIVRFDQRDLDAMISNFEAGERRVPLVIGHPKTNDPAYGWVSSLRRMGDVLQAKFAQVHRDVVNLVQEGRYKNVSLSLFQDKSLRHVGLLGAVQPAVSGLQPVTFASGPVGFEFELPAEGADAAPASNVQALEERIRQLEEELKQVKEALGLEQKVRGETELAYREFREAQAKKDREQRFAWLVAHDKIMPGEKAATLDLAESLAKVPGTVDFSSPEGANEQISREEAFWRRLEARPAQGLLIEYTAPPASKRPDENIDPLKWV